MNGTDAASDFSCCVVVPWLSEGGGGGAVVSGLVGTGLVLRGCTRARGAVCGVWRRVCVRHVDTSVPVYVGGCVSGWSGV